MADLRSFVGKVCPLDRVNVDTDQIIPKQFLKRIERQGFGKYLFYHWRFDDHGNKRDDFILNQEQYKDAKILVVGHNFGCGSSREHAPWSLLDYGIHVIIAPSYADIFYNNCLKNGILPIRLKEEEVMFLLENGLKPDYRLYINLEEQTVSDQESFYSSFQIDSYWKGMLLNGWDEISLTLQHEDQITHYEKRTANVIG